jgi:hypothetical protein
MRLENDATRPNHNPWPVIAFGLAVLCAALPILMHLHLPMVDLPNHIARHVIMAKTSGPLLDYYSVSNQIVPNSSVDLLWQLLGFPIGAERFSQIMMAFYAVSLIASAMVLSRVVNGRWTVWPAASGLLVFNGPFFWGFQNYLVAMPFAILGLALWLHTEHRGVLYRLVFFIPFAAALCVMHLFAFAALGIAACGRELQVLIAAKGGRLRQLTKSLFMSVPFILPLLWLFYSVVGGPESVAGTATIFGDQHRWLDLLTTIFGAVNADLIPGVNLTGLLCLALFALCFLTLLRGSGRRLVLAHRMRGPLIAIALATLLAPTWLNGVALVHIRFPFIVVVLMLAATTWKDLSQTSAKALALVFLIMFVARGLLVEEFAAKHDAEIQTLVGVLRNLPAGARVLPLRTEGRQDSKRLSHVQAYAIITRDAFIPTLFQGAHAISLKQRWTDFADPVESALDECLALPEQCHSTEVSPTFLSDWRRKFTHVLLVDPASARLDSQPDLKTIAKAGRFTLYEIMGAVE